MKKSTLFYWLILIPLLISGISCQHHPKQQHPYSDLFHSLVGNWKGCAVKTPIGPRPYDINFRLNDKVYLNGVADPSPFSDHHWSYHLEGDVLWLNFLSTFRGNTTPTWLSAIKRESKTVTFRSKRVRKLKVDVTVLDNTQNIEIYLHNKPHVSIRLVRTHEDDTSRSDCLLKLKVSE